MDLIEARFAAHVTALHSHEEVEIGMVMGGSRLVICGNREYQAPPGSVVVFRPGAFHAGAPLAGPTPEYRSFLVRPEVLASDCGWTGGGWLSGPVVPDPDLAARLFTAHADLRNPGTGPEVARALFEELGRHRHSSILPAEEPSVVRQTREYFDRCYADTVRLSGLAGLMGMSVFRLIRSFRNATGLPPYAYLEQMRIHRAVRLLREGHPASRVALLTGFADQSHLTRFFTRLVGVPPGRYQRGARPGPPGTGATSFKTADT